MKNAQNRVLDKYSEQIKEAVEAVLEQEEDEEEEILDREEELTPDILAGEETDDIFDDEESETEEGGLEDEVPSAISAGEEEVEIDLDQLSSLVDKEMEGTEESISDDAGDVAEAVEDLKDTVEDLKDTVEDIKAIESSEEAEEEGEEEEIPINYPAEQTITEQDEEINEEEFVSALNQFAKGQTEEKSTANSDVKVDMGKDEPKPHQWVRNVAGKEEDKERRRVIANLKEQKLNLISEKKKLEKQLTKYKEAIKTMVKKVEEVNLQNARLLYKNQALSSDSLNERQKAKIVGAISKANSVREAKLIYETLQSAIVDERIKESPKSLHEVSSRKTSPFVRSEKESSNIEEDNYKTRMQKLAGLI
jgi:hypothetical protein